MEYSGSFLKLTLANDDAKLLLELVLSYGAMTVNRSQHWFEMMLA